MRFPYSTYIIITRRQESSERIVFLIVSLPSAEFNMRESSNNNNKSFWKATTCHAFNSPSLAVIRLVHWFITHILTLTIWETLLSHYYMHKLWCWWAFTHLNIKIVNSSVNVDGKHGRLKCYSPPFWKCPEFIHRFHLFLKIEPLTYDKKCDAGRNAFNEITDAKQTIRCLSDALVDVLFTLIISCDVFEWMRKGKFRT